jgi:predicted PurR-regulated permease PerM
VNQNWLVTAFFFALLLAILYGAFRILAPFLPAITWAVIVAILVYPPYAWLLRALKGRATLAALIVVTIVTLLVLLPGAELGWFLSQEAIAVVQTVRALVTDEGVAEWMQQRWVQQLLDWWNMISFHLAPFEINWRPLLAQIAQVSSTFVVSHATGIAQNILVFAFDFIVMLLTLFFLLRDGADFFYWTRILLPMDQEHQERLFRKIADAVLAVVRGSLVVAMIQGLLAGLAYSLAGVPFAALWGVVTAFASLLPVGGSAIVSVPASLYLFLQGETLRAVLLLIWCLGFVGVVDNILKPLLIGNRLGLPVLFLFFGILGGISLFGALGIILGPVLLALLRALLDLYMEEYGNA